MKQFSAKVIKNEILSSDYCILWLENKLKLSEILPGQFFQLKVPDTNSMRLRIPISVYDADKTKIGFMIKIIGEGTEMLAKVKPGDFIDVIGSLGTAFDYSGCKKVLLVSGGIGYAPLFYLSKKLESKGVKSVWIHGGRSETDVFNCDLPFSDDGSVGERGFVTEGLKKELQKSDYDMIFSCGPDIMMKKCNEIADQFNAKIQVSLEEYMACGIGVCYGCAVKIKTENGDVYKRVCKDGPVFLGSEVVWNE